MIKTVFLDMDGVMVDFLGGLHRALGVPYQYDQYPYEKGKWNMLTDIKGFEDIPATFEQCNDCCTTNFWANLEWMPDGHDIMRLVTSTFKPEQIYLLTTPMPNPGSYTGKVLWVQKHLPEFSKRLIVTSAPKNLFARPDTLLVDDKDENVEEFVKAGGDAILVPRLWNELHGWADETYQVVKNSLGNFKC